MRTEMNDRKSFSMALSLYFFTTILKIVSLMYIRLYLRKADQKYYFKHYDLCHFHDRYLQHATKIESIALIRYQGKCIKHLWHKKSAYASSTMLCTHKQSSNEIKSECPYTKIHINVVLLTPLTIQKAVRIRMHTMCDL